MVLYYVLIAIGVLVAIILVKKYLDERAGLRGKRFCYECNRYFTAEYVHCPKCGLKFGT